MARHTNYYTVAYRMRKFGKEKRIAVPATSKYEAYDKASFEEIPKREGHYPYSAWVIGVTYQNGNYRTFNTIEGLPY